MNKISQKEYLKKYLSSDDKLGKKKKKKSKDKSEKIARKTVKIIDDDACAYVPEEEIDECELYGTNEEAPQIVGVIDERAPTVILKQEYQDSGKWKALENLNKINQKNNSKTVKNYQDRSPPPRKHRHSSDESPPRQSSNKLPPSKRRCDSDESPPRERKVTKDSSPPRRKRQNSDESPPRRRQPDDNSPPRRKRRDSDESPPRRRQPDDNSPPRRKRRDSDESPPRQRKSRNSPDHKNPRNRSYEEEASSRGRSNDRKSNHKRSRWSPEKTIKEEQQSPPHSSKMTKTLDGKSSGLQNARKLKIESDEFRSRQEKMFSEMKPDVSGRDADVVIRDRRGRNKEFEYDLEKEQKKMEAEAERKKIYDRWGKGLKQIEDIERKKQEFIHEANKPLARFAEDDDLKDYLKNQERLDDPMLQYMRKKRSDEKKSKGILEKPTYRGDFPDNRFGIRPGYRWDGVDRSNGYEKKYFNMINSKKSMEEEAYRYSTEDM